MCDVNIRADRYNPHVAPPSRHEAAKPSETRRTIDPLTKCLFLQAKTRFYLRPATIDIFTLACVKVTNLLSDAKQQMCQSGRVPSTKAPDFSAIRDFQTGDRIASLHERPGSVQRTHLSR